MTKNLHSIQILLVASASKKGVVMSGMISNSPIKNTRWVDFIPITHTHINQRPFFMVHRLSHMFSQPALTQVNSVCRLHRTWKSLTKTRVSVFFCKMFYQMHSLKLRVSLHLKMDDWKTPFPLVWDAIFRGVFREGRPKNSRAHTLPKTNDWTFKIKNLLFPDMGVSETRGTPKWMIYNGKPY